MSMQRIASVYQSQKTRDKKRRKKNISVIVWVVVSVLTLGLLVYLSHHPAIQIEKVIVSDLQYTDRTDVEKIINQQLNGQYIGLFSRANTVIFPRNQIVRTVKQAYPAIKDISFEWRGSKSIAVRITEHAPVATWCDTPVTPAPALTHAESENIAGALPQIITNASGEQCFFVNEDGFIFAPVKQPEKAQGLVTLYGNLITDPLRKTYTNKKTFTHLLDFVRLARRLEIVITEIWTTTGEAYAFVAQPGTQLYVDSEDDVVEVFDNLKTVIERDAINKAQFANIKYIDLRFGNRVFYKLR